ncbi:MAG: 50S ribosomal protein L10 [Candidatus Woesearchaeota archaeon]
MANITDQKKKEVADFVALVKEYPVVGIVNMMGMPTPQVQSMRAQLRKSVVLRMTKKTLSKIILQEAEKSKPGVAKLAENLKGMPAFIFTKDNPFILFKILKKNKSSAPAKGGQIAPKDIVVPAGPTPFNPGPIISELASVGIKSGIDGGKVAVKADSVVAKEGDVISAKLASLLTRLEIYPMEVGLDLLSVYEDGMIYDKKVLDIDEEVTLQELQQAHTWAFNLAMDAQVYTDTTLPLFITNAHKDAVGLAVSQAIPQKEVMGQLLAKAVAHECAIASLL